MNIFHVVQYVLLPCAIFYLIKKGRKGWYTDTNAVASILTIIGVCGTFIGIWFGLRSFDTTNIEGSIPSLLEGLKIAFFSSILGIVSAIILKFILLVIQAIDSYRGHDPSKKVIDTLETLEEIKKSTASIKSSLSRGNEKTVFTLLEDWTSTVSDQVGEIAKDVGQIATKQLIDALKEFIQDFNKNLSEQFGENFKQLNVAVKDTVTWQEQYRQQMDKLADEFRIAAKSVEQSREALASAAGSLMTIKNQSDGLVSIAETLDPILRTLNNQLEAFSELRRRAGEALPVIEKRLDDLTKGFSDAVGTAITDSHESMERLRETLQNILEGQTQELGKIVERNREDIENHVKALHDAICSKVDTLDNLLEKELTKSLQILAGRFKSLSDGFVQNYSELSKRYSETIENFDQIVKSLEKLVDVSRLQDNIEQEESE